MSGILNVMLAGKAAAAAGSVWGDHGSNATLSTTVLTNDTVTGNTSDWASVRGTQFYNTGKHYFEVKLSAPTNGNFIVGLMDDLTAIVDLNNFNLESSVGTYFFNGTAKVNGAGLGGVDLGTGPTLAANDILGIAFDADNGFHYLSLNNVWFLSGVPTSGATGTGYVGNYIAVPIQNFRPMVVVFGSSNGTFQLVTSGFTYTPPSGYSAWG